MEATHQYEVNVDWNHHRIGTLSSPELTTNIDVATPPDFPKGVADIWSPEHLLIASVNSCFMATFLAIADNSKLEFTGFKSKAIGDVEKIEGKYQLTTIHIKAILTIPIDTDVSRASRIMELSEKNCLISNSVKSQVHLEFEVVVE